MLNEKIDYDKYKRPEFEAELSKLTDYKPNSWQKIIREQKKRFKIICIGRRGGKSLYVVHDSQDGLITDLVTPNQYVWVVAPNYDLTQRVWNELYTTAITHFKPIIQSIHNTKGNYRLETVFGTVIEAKSAEDPEKLVGVGLNKIIVDEAAMVKEKAWTQSLRPTLIDHAGKAIFISTPKGKNWFWELWKKGQDKNYPDWGSWQFSSFKNEFLNRKELNEIVKDMPDYEYRQEIMALFTETAEQIFRNFNEQAIGAFKEPQKGHRYQIGIDLGRKSSYTVITVIDEMKEPYEVVFHDRFRKIDWNLQKLRIKKVYNKYSCLRARVDATGIGDPFSEDLENSGIRTDPFIYHENSKKQVIDKTAIFIEEKRIIYPKIPQLLTEMETFGREISKESGRVKYKALGNQPDDCVHSLALAVWGLPDRPRKVLKEEKEKKPYKPISKITGY